MPEWKRVNQGKLLELSQRKIEAAASSRLGHKSEAYKEACKVCKREVKKLINGWWCQKARAIQEPVDCKDHNYQFAAYRELRRVFASNGKPAGKLKDKDGNLLLTKTERVNRWQEYFQELLNVPAHVTTQELAGVSCKVPMASLGDVPRMHETIAAIKRLKKGKASGPDGIEAELLMHLDCVNVRVLHECFCRIWEGHETLPKEWRASCLIPLPKKGDKTACKNWRGILLASMPGKLYARILNARLYKYAEDVGSLPESQCGFRAGRAVIDSVSCFQICMELAAYRHHPFYVLFVDLVKAYDSVSRSGLREVLQKKGVPEKIVKLVKDYYSGKCTQVSVEGRLSASFELGTGLGQGCWLAPLLFNIFLAAIFETWQEKSGGGATWQSRTDGVLHHREEFDKYSSWHPLQIEDLTYADDAALVTASLMQLMGTARRFQTHLQAWGVNLSVEKTKALTTEPGDHEPIAVEDFDGSDSIEFCADFEYSGVIATKQGNGEKAILDRLNKARKAFWDLNTSVWRLRQISISTKIQVYRACVLSVLLFGAELWTPTFTARKALERAYHIWLRRIAQFGLRDQREHTLSNADLRAWLGAPSVLQLVRQRRLRWLGHIGRIPDSRLPKQVLFASLPADTGFRLPGHQAGKRLREEFVKDLAHIDVDKQGWLQRCNTQEGNQTWREKTRGFAYWYAPKAIDPNADPPDREAEPRRLRVAGKVRVSVQKRWEQAKQEYITRFVPSSTFLQMEEQEGGRELLIAINSLIRSKRVRSPTLLRLSKNCAQQLLSRSGKVGLKRTLIWGCFGLCCFLRAWS